MIAAVNRFASRTRVAPLYIVAYSGLPHWELAVIDDSYHFIMLDQPVAFDAALRGALAQ